MPIGSRLRKNREEYSYPNSIFMPNEWKDHVKEKHKLTKWMIQNVKTVYGLYQKHMRFRKFNSMSKSHIPDEMNDL